MTVNISQTIHQFVEQAIQSNWLRSEDRNYITNRLLALLQLDVIDDALPMTDLPDLLTSMDALCDYAVSTQLIEDIGYQKEQFEAAIMDLIVPLPSVLNDQFWQYYAQSPATATQYFYALSQTDDYIKTRHIAKNIAFDATSAYGDLQITINLSKPEKDPKDIAAARLAQPAHYPKCLLCTTNEGYKGRSNHPARQSHRLIRITLDAQPYAMQYSPYVYYNEHSIFLNEQHIPMVVDKNCLSHLVAITELFPHYFAGSNADLPIVGGSILSHDHYQGGQHTFPMALAPAAQAVTLNNHPEVTAELVAWPMSVLRLRSTNKHALIEAADALLHHWRQYSDETVDVLAYTDDTPHNTITPIARRKGEAFEMDLVLRNNRTSAQYPDGIFHPHQDVQHIKKENIGLIEVMGLAILPARLVEETAQIARYLLNQTDLESVASYHQAWASNLKATHPTCQATEVERIIQQSIGVKFVRVLEDAGVFKQTPEGQSAFLRFVNSFNQLTI